MPTGQQDPPRYSDLAQLRQRGGARVAERIDRAHEASLAYLDALPAERR
jgi:hypothetical protein